MGKMSSKDFVWVVFFVFKMREILVGLCADRKDAVERKNSSDYREREHYWSNGLEETE